MGSKHSKQIDHHLSTQEPNSYPNIVRAYPKLDHRSVLVSQDVARFALHENRHFKRHNQLSNSHNYNQQQKSAPRNNLYKSSSKYEQLQYQHLEIKKPRYDQNIHGKKLVLQKSQSSDNLPNSANLITAEQLLRDREKQRQRPQSPSAQSFNVRFSNQNIEKSFSTTNANQIFSSKTKRKTIQADLQLVLINQNDLQNAHEIGKGNFGTVYHALYQGSRDVALKTLNSHRKDLSNGKKRSIGENDDDIYDFLHEADIMTRLQHANLLRIIGVTFFGEDKQLSLVTDYMKNGSLLDYLRKHRDIFIKSDPKEITSRLNSFAKQIFQAMLYLEERSIIHRDLAARNCLIGKEDILKVADFGLTRLTDCGLYKGTYRTVFAVRWTSPEGIFSSKYTSRSDVWSYGITLWEIFSLGERPYGKMSNIAIKIALKNGSESVSPYLPQSTQFGSDEAYTHIILPCLTHNVTMRPRFRDLKDRILNIFTDRIQ